MGYVVLWLHQKQLEADIVRCSSIDALSLLPSSRQVALTPSSSEEGMGLTFFVTWLHLMGELSTKSTEGEKSLGRCTHAVFLP